MERLPKTGELYRDLTNKVYQVVTVAAHAQTGEQMVVYQAMFEDFGVYVMPLCQFGKEVDFGKYPQAVQGHMFEKIGKDGKEAGGGRQTAAQPESGPNAFQPEPGPNAFQPGPRPRTQSPAESRRAFHQNAQQAPGEGGYDYEKRRRRMEEREQRREMFRKSSERHESATEELRANPCLMKFLEADTYEARYHVLNEIQDDMTDRLIDDIAVVLDVVIPEGALNDRFHQLRNIILTRQKYETSRFR